MAFSRSAKVHCFAAAWCQGHGSNRALRTRQTVCSCDQRLLCHLAQLSAPDGWQRSRGRCCHSSASPSWLCPRPPLFPVAGAPVKNLFPLVVADVSKEDQCSECIKQIIAEHGEIDHAVSCFGAWWQKGAERWHMLLCRLLCWEWKTGPACMYRVLAGRPCWPFPSFIFASSKLSSSPPLGQNCAAMLTASCSVMSHAVLPRVLPAAAAGVLTEQSYSEFLHVIHDFAGSHFTFAKYVLPVLKKADTSSFLFITGGVGESVPAVGATESWVPIASQHRP